MKVHVDIGNIVEQLRGFGYELSESPIVRENNGKNWQLKFSNSPLTATIYGTNTKGNTVIGGKGSKEEREELKRRIENIRWDGLRGDSLSMKIQELIKSRTESTTHDFKVEWHKENGALLHDILCLANNLEHQEAYLIIGVSDDYQLQGLEERKKTNDFHNWLTEIKKNFANEEVPECTLENMEIRGKKIDVLVIKQSDKLPFYLSKQYKKVNPYQIYTRNGDTNTPINEEASKSDIEKLWSYRIQKSQ